MPALSLNGMPVIKGKMPSSLVRASTRGNSVCAFPTCEQDLGVGDRGSPIENDIVNTYVNGREESYA